MASLVMSIILAVLLVAITRWVYRWRNPKSGGLLPPGSMGLPIIGESLQFFSPYSLDGIPPFISERVSRYGSLFKTSIVGQPMVVSTDSEVNYYIFQQEGKLFQCYYTESAVRITGQQGLTVHHGTMHKYLRSFILSLIGPESLKDRLLLEMDQNTSEHMNSWTCSSDVDIKDASEIMIFMLAAKKILSCNEEETLKLRRNYKAFMDGFVSFPLGIPGTAYHAAIQGRKKVIKFIKNRIGERRVIKRSHHCGDFLDQVMEEVENTETPLTEEIAVDMVFLLLFAAYETTSAAIALAFKYLKQQPQVLKQLQEEHNAILQNREDNESRITWAEYKSMTFTHMVINEIVRLANIVPGIFRKVMEDVEIKGYTIPAGWTFMVCPPFVHLDSNKYDDPFKFNPWRWIGQELNVGSKKFMVFGGGSRLCAGADFAKLQMAIFLHHLVTKYRWEVTKEGNVFRQPGLVFRNGMRIRFSRI